jgi:tellurite resistance-related uncharacterized protein/catechol 2,3-dioxygenase-like lactoylglutathione lyase family enzyme
VQPWDTQITFVYVTDLDAAERFYMRLGLTRVLDQGTCRILSATTGACIGLCARPEQVQPGGVILTLVSVDLEDRVADLRSHGVSFEVEPRYNPEYDITQAFLRDPDGHLVELQRFEDLDWPRPEWARMPALPPGVVSGRRTRMFDEHTVPAGLRRAHTTRAGTWGRIEVEAGALRYRIREGRGGRFVVRPGRPGIIRPEEPHDVEPLGEVRFAVQFLSGPE